MATESPRLYGVSYGNGNDGVSQMFPDFYVMTSEPYTLARGAVIDTLKTEWHAAADDSMFVDGEAAYTVYAVISDPLDEEPCEEGEHWSDGNGAWLICEVFPVADDEVRDTAPMFDSIESALSEAALVIARKSEA